MPKGVVLRISLGRENTRGDIDRLLEVLPRAVEKLRALAPQIPAS
ncbi:MAG TPA: hypothetical protein VG845_00055 [Dehalococcoidia bacterium]|nr:hypothetical protein [Dehalococcoidia bacterium]